MARFHCKHCPKTFNAAWRVAQHMRLDHPTKVRARIRPALAIPTAESAVREVVRDVNQNGEWREGYLMGFRDALTVKVSKE